MGGILLLSDGTDSLRARLASEGHLVVSATSPEAAIERAAEIDLVLTDVRLPGMDADELRDKMRAARGAKPLPFVFFSRGEEDAAVVARLGSASEPLRVFVKPVDVSRISETVGRVLSELVLEGEMSDGSFVKRLESIALARSSGVLTVSREPTVKKIVFKGGGLAFCASNEPRELVGQHFLKSGFVTEEDLRKAINLQITDSRPLGKILQAMAKVTAEQVERTLARKFRETILDVFLWTTGVWVWSEGEVREAAPFETLELLPIIGQGRRRAQRWPQLVSMLPQDSARFTVVKEKLPEGFPVTPADRLLIELAGAGKTLRELRDALPGQDFGIYSRFSDWMQAGYVRLAEGAIVAPPPDVPTLLDRAGDALFAEDATLARELFQAVLALEPGNSLAEQGLSMLDAKLLTFETGVPVPIAPAPEDEAVRREVEERERIARIEAEEREQRERERAALERRAWEGLGVLERSVREKAEREAEERRAEERRIREQVAREREEAGKRARLEREAREREHAERERKLREEQEAWQREKTEQLQRLQAERDARERAGMEAATRALVQEQERRNDEAREAREAEEKRQRAAARAQAEQEAARRTEAERLERARREAEIEPVPLIPDPQPRASRAPLLAGAAAVLVLIALAGGAARFARNPAPTPVAVATATLEITATPTETPMMVIELVKKPTPAERGSGASLRERGQARLDVNDAAGAARYFRQAIAADPDDAQAHLGLGTASMLLGEKAAAKESFERFLELAPDDPQAPLVQQMLQ